MVLRRDERSPTDSIEPMSTTSLPSSGLSILRRAAVLALTAATLSVSSAHAGVTTHMVAKWVQSKAESAMSTTRTPGRDGPLAPSASQGFDACADLFPGRAPIDVHLIDAKWGAAGLCSNHFAVLHSSLTKTPMVVVERLNRATLVDAKGEQRTNDFYPDSRLRQGKRAELGDYARSGYDRGHLASAANQPDQRAMIQSFALSNMVPQDPNNNRKIWSKIESDVRHYARRAQGDVFVFSGPLYFGSVEKIGYGQVWVPTHLFKLVYDQASGRSWAYILPNTPDARIERPMDYDEFVRQTGWKLLPSSVG